MKNKISNSTFLRLLDLVTNAIMHTMGAYEQIEEKPILLRIKAQLRKVLNKNNNQILKNKKDYLLIIGQVPTDANFLLHSDFLNHTQLIKICIDKYPGQIIFREHPMYKGMYEREIYELEKRSQHFSISRSDNLAQEIISSKKILVVNSTVGIEVLLNHHRRPICLGESSYRQFCFNTLDEALNGSDQLEYEEIITINKWFEVNFIKGHFREKDLTNIASNIIKKIKLYV